MLKILAALLLAAISSLGRAEIIATIKPLTLIAAAVTDGLGQPGQLLPDGVSAHDYSLRPSDRLRLQRAELVIRVGPTHERFLESLLNAKTNVLTLSSLPDLKRLPLRRLEDGAPLPASLDSHLWLDPENAILMARAIAGRLGRQHPEQANRYQANAERFAVRLRQAWLPLQQRLAALPHRDYAAYHDAYQYLESSLGLRFAGSLSASPEIRPGAKHLLLMKTRLQRQRVTCLVREPGSSEALLRQVALPGARQAVLDETFRGAGDFVQGWSALGQAMAHCLGNQARILVR